MAAYLPYVPFTDGWYARFMLPAVPALVILMVTVMERGASRLPARAGLAVLTAATIVLGGCWLERADGLTFYLAVEAWELDAFRLRFRGRSPAADLDWPPRATLGNVVFLYDLADRDRCLAGERIPTEIITWGIR